MIPKIIHLCWFSGEKYPKDIKFCIDSWKRVLPDFQIKIWTKEMALSTGIDFVKEAISVRKWAFAADVIRLYAVYHDGGVYMDSDVYVQKRFDEFLDKKCAFFQEYYPIADPTGYIDDNGYSTGKAEHIPGMGIQAALFMAEPGNKFIAELLAKYKTKHFILEDGTYNMRLLAPTIYALEAEKFGYRYLNVKQHLTDDLVIYPSDFVGSGIMLKAETNFAIHCIYHSWDDEYLKMKSKREPILIRIKIFMYRLLCKLIGKPYSKPPTTFKDRLCI